MSAPAPLNITGQILCAEVQLMRLAADGVHEELVPNLLRLEDGTCAHRDPELFAKLTMEQSGGYLGLLGEKAELFHVWGAGARAPRGQEDERTGPDPVAMVEGIRAAVVPAYEGHVPQPMAPDAMARVVEVERGPHPEPEYTGEWCAQLTDCEGLRLPAPAPVLLLAELAREAGWEVSMRYARGTGIHASQGRPLALRHSIALRFTGHPMTDRGAVAVYETNVSKVAWSWSSRWVIGSDIGHRGELTMAELETFLRAPDECSPGWFAAIVTAAGEAAARVKLRAKMKPCDPDCEVDHAHKAAPKPKEAKHGA